MSAHRPGGSARICLRNAACIATLLLVAVGAGAVWAEEAAPSARGGKKGGVAVGKEPAVRLEALVGELEQAKARIVELRKLRRRLAEERAELRLRLEDATAQIEELTNSLQQAWRERDAKEEALMALQQQFERTRKVEGALRARVNAQQSELERLKGEREALQRELRASRSRIAVLERAREQLRSVVTRALRELEDFATELAAVMTENEQLVRTLASMRGERQELARGIAEIRARVERHGAQLARLRKELAAVVGDEEAALAGAGAGPSASASARMARTAPEDAATADGVATGELPLAVIEPAAGAEATAPELVLARDEAGRLFGILDGIRFAAEGDGQLTPESLRSLARLAAVLKRHAETSVRILEPEDKAADAPHDRDLARRRVQRVRGVLIRRHGIDPDRIIFPGAGEIRAAAAKPAAEGSHIDVYIRP